MAFQSWQESQDYSALWNFHEQIKSLSILEPILVSFCWRMSHPKHSKQQTLFISHDFVGQLGNSFSLASSSVAESSRLA